MKAHIPVTLVTGFLGAGKTTLLEHVLGSKPELRVAVIENEFGDVGIDGSNLTMAPAALFELNDGCVCCTIRADLIEVLQQFISRRSEFDHVIIETTGLAEPTPILRVFDRPEVSAACTLNGVITVVDAHHMKTSLDEVTACEEQITYADLLVLNKIDGLPETVLVELENQIRRLNPLADIVRSKHAQVDVDAVLDMHERRIAPPSSCSGAHDSDHDHHLHHHHDATIGTVAVNLDGEVNVDALDLWLGDLAHGQNPFLLRMKGFLAVPGSEQRFLFNAVRTALDVRPGKPWGTAPRENRIVFIGRGLDSINLQNGFDRCRAD